MRLLVLIFAALFALPAAAADRVEVPITQHVLRDGTPRYTIPIQIGDQTLEAMLDSGSVGIRVMPGALRPDNFAPGRERVSYGYTSGVELSGSVGQAKVAIGGLATPGPIGVQVVETVGCSRERPNCPASRVAAKDYGIGGNGIAGAGFKAIVGVAMGETEAPNPLTRIGERRWIIVLPWPGEREPGKLILNPSDAELQGFVRFPNDPVFKDGRGGWHDAIPGCLELGKGKPVCGPLLLDSGATAIQVSPGRGVRIDHPGPGAAARLLIGDPQRPALRLNFRTGQEPSGRLIIEDPGGQPRTRISAGALPYYSVAAFYDARAHVVGIRPR